MKSIVSFTLLFLFLTTSHLHGQEESFSIAHSKESIDGTYDDLTISEWKKFKDFQFRLKQSKFSLKAKEEKLKSYARDSLQILQVKLLAVKILDEKDLLEKDIAENTEFYIALLKELKESDINRSEYLFLEKKLAFLNQEALEKRLLHSQWMNMGLILLLLILALLFYRLRVRQKNTNISTLSKQEKTIRNLILQGKSNKEIANELFISLSTVKTHITNIYGKLNVTNRQELLQKSTGTST